VTSLFRTNEMDQFLRALKLFYTTTSKKYYNMLLDAVLAVYEMNSANDGTPMPAKKDVFRHLTQSKDQYGCFLTFSLICC